LAYIFLIYSIGGKENIIWLDNKIIKILQLFLKINKIAFKKFKNTLSNLKINKLI
jgi:hypothetical protein